MRVVIGAIALMVVLSLASMFAPTTAQTYVIPAGKAADDTAAAAVEAPAAAVVPGAPGPLTPAWSKIPAKYQSAFFTAATKSGCAMATPQLLAALVEVETGGAFTNLTSPAGARGWAQIMPNTEKAAGLTSEQVLDPNYAIPAAAKILCLKEAATRKNPSSPVVRALAAYNGGEGNVKASGMPAQIRGYAAKVVNLSVKYTVPKWAPAAAPLGKAAPGPVAKGGLPRNTGTVPGIVALGHALAARGIRVGEGPAPFGPVYPVHAVNSYHKKGLALDLNYDGKKVSETVYFDALAPELVAAGYRVIWRQRGHFDHIHVDAGKPAGMLKL